MEIVLDANSKITLEGNSYYTSLTNEDLEGNNIVKGDYEFTQYDEQSISRPSGGQSGGQPGGQPPNRPGEDEDDDEEDVAMKLSFSLLINLCLILSIILWLWFIK